VFYILLLLQLFIDQQFGEKRNVLSDKKKNFIIINQSSIKNI